MNIDSKYFTLPEMLESHYARVNDIKEQFTPPDSVIKNLQALITNVLDPLRKVVGPLTVSSGYRCLAVNKGIGGVANSQHVIGQAADLQGNITISNAALFKKIQDLKLPFDQLIWEYGDKDQPAWVHVSYSNRNRRQVLFIGVK